MFRCALNVRVPHHSFHGPFSYFCAFWFSCLPPLYFIFNTPYIVLFPFGVLFQTPGDSLIPAHQYISRIFGSLAHWLVSALSLCRLFPFDTCRPMPSLFFSAISISRLGAVGSRSCASRHWCSKPNRVDSGKFRCMKNWREGTKVHLVGPRLTTST